MGSHLYLDFHSQMSVLNFLTTYFYRMGAMDCVIICTPCRIQTCDLLVRSQTLYSAELTGQIKHIIIGFQPIYRLYHGFHDHTLDFAFLLSDSLHLGHFTIIYYMLLVANYDFHVIFPQCTRLCCVRTLYQPSDKFHVHAFVSLSLDHVVVFHTTIFR